MPKDKWIVFYSCSIAARIVTGYADSLIGSCQCSVIGQAFPDSKGELIGTNEAFVGIGVIFGPAMGSIIYGLTGYEITFFTFASVGVIGLF